MARRSPLRESTESRQLEAPDAGPAAQKTLNPLLAASTPSSFGTTTLRARPSALASAALLQAVYSDVKGSRGGSMPDRNFTQRPLRRHESVAGRRPSSGPDAAFETHSNPMLLVAAVPAAPAPQSSMPMQRMMRRPPITLTLPQSLGSSGDFPADDNEARRPRVDAAGAAATDPDAAFPAESITSHAALETTLPTSRVGFAAEHAHPTGAHAPPTAAHHHHHTGLPQTSELGVMVVARPVAPTPPNSLQHPRDFALPAPTPVPGVAVENAVPTAAVLTSPLPTPEPFRDVRVAPSARAAATPRRASSRTSRSHVGTSAARATAALLAAAHGLQPPATHTTAAVKDESDTANAYSTRAGGGELGSPPARGYMRPFAARPAVVLVRPVTGGDLGSSARHRSTTSDGTASEDRSSTAQPSTGAAASSTPVSASGGSVALPSMENVTSMWDRRDKWDAGVTDPPSPFEQLDEPVSRPVAASVTALPPSRLDQIAAIALAPLAVQHLLPASDAPPPSSFASAVDAAPELALSARPYRQMPVLTIAGRATTDAAYVDPSLRNEPLVSVGPGPSSQHASRQRISSAVAAAALLAAVHGAAGTAAGGGRDPQSSRRRG